MSLVRLHEVRAELLRDLERVQRVADAHLLQRVDGGLRRGHLRVARLGALVVPTLAEGAGQWQLQSKMLKNKPSLANVGVDTAENRPS